MCIRDSLYPHTLQDGCVSCIIEVILRILINIVPLAWISIPTTYKVKEGSEREESEREGGEWEGERAEPKDTRERERERGE
eukprot:1358260-Amorphochlora_amoeboformis.AAC.1